LNAVEGASSVTKYITWSSARNNNNTTNVYLRKSDILPTNESPFTVPFDSVIYTIVAQTTDNESWTAEVRRDTGSGFVVIGSVIISGADNGINDTISFNVSKGDKIAMYCNGSGIKNPSIEVYLRSI